MRPAAALVGGSRSRIVDEDAAHEFRGKPEEMSTALPVDGLLRDQTQKRFVHQRGFLNGVIGALATQVSVGELAQLCVQER